MRIWKVGVRSSWGRRSLATGLTLATALATGLTVLAPLTSPLSAQGQTTNAAGTEAYPEIAAAARTITAADMYARIAFLASDELRGRNTPSPGLEKAAEYIAQQFRDFGLEPGGDGNTYIQRYPYRQHSVDPAVAFLGAKRGGSAAALRYGSDFFLVPSAEDSATGTPVFAGTVEDVRDGFPAEVNGRIAIVAAGANLRSGIFRLPQAAGEAGATGLLLVLSPEMTEQAVARIAGQLGNLGREMAIPTFGVRRGPAGALFSAEGSELSSLLQRPAGGTVVVAAHTTLRMVTGVKRVEHQVPNVVGILRGSDPTLRNEYVILSAHFDHVGVGQPDAKGDSIYNGADDDASGTSVVLEAAQAFASLPTPPRRSVVFLTVSGEEKGLLGSAYFGDHPTIPIEHVVADINMDMVGRNARDTLVALGQEYTTLGALAHEIADAAPDVALHIIKDPDPSENAFFRSDHIVFVRKKIPTIFFTAWLHEDYHRPSDEVQKIDTEKAARVGRLVFRLARQVADSPEPPAWLEGGWEQVEKILEAGRR